MTEAFPLDEFCRRHFSANPATVETLTIGTYNETSRVTLSDGTTIIVRVGPPHDEGIAKGAAALALVDGLDGLAPRTLALDSWGDRAVTAQSVVPGTPASDRVGAFDDAQARAYYRDLGRVTRSIHDIHGERFGSLLGGGESSWASAVAERLKDRVAEYTAAGLDARELTVLLEGVPRHREQLDAARPSLLHGDLWSLNILLDDQNRISGIVDWDAASWGDPLADWTLHRIRQRGGTVADAFWETYGEPPGYSEVRTIYAAALNVSGSRLDIERRRLAIAEISAEHWDLGPIADEFAQLDR